MLWGSNHAMDDLSTSRHIPRALLSLVFAGTHVIVLTAHAGSAAASPVRFLPPSPLFLNASDTQCVSKWHMDLFMGTVGRGISRQDHDNITRKRARAPESKAFPHHEVPIQRYRQKRSGWRHVSVIRAHCITLSAHTSMSSIHSIDFLDWLRSVLSWSWSNHLKQRERAC